MTKLGPPVPKDVTNITKKVKECLEARNIKTIDANDTVTGRDFLNKIWDMILSVPLGVAIISRDMTSGTLSNIFYEIGLMQALGKETLIIKTKGSVVPSDFVRTEHIEYNKGFANKIEKFLGTLFEMAKHYDLMASELGQNPVLAIDYLRRAYLITADQKYKNRIHEIMDSNSSLDKQSRDSMRNLLEF